MGGKKVALKDRELTPKENRFIWHWLNNGHNGTKAVRDAGYSCKTEKAAGVLASKLLGKVSIYEAIKKHEEMIVESTQITAERIAKELAQIAFSNITDYVEIEDATYDFLDLDEDEEAEPVQKKNTYKAVKIKSTKDMKNLGAVAAIKEGRHGIEIKLWDKLDAIKILAQYVGMLLNPGEKPLEEELDMSKLDSEEVLLLYNLTNKAKRLTNGTNNNQ